MKNKITASKYCLKVFDGTHDTPKPTSKGRPLITSKYLMGGFIDFKNAYNISEEDYKEIQKRSAVSKWDVLFSMIGTVGDVYLEKSDKIDYAIKNIGAFSCKDEYKAKWLYYYFKSPYAKKVISNFLNGAVQKFLPLEFLRDFPVEPYDPSKKQMVDLLFNIDLKIEINNKINRELEELSKSIYSYWFVQFEFPNEQNKPYKSSGGEMVFNEDLKREIPKEWEVEDIEKCCEVIDCLHSKKPNMQLEDNNYYLLQLENLRNDGLIDLTNKYYVSKKDYQEWISRIEVCEDDMLITNAGRVAATIQIPSWVKAGIGRNITAIRPKSVSPTYLFLAFKGIDMIRQIKGSTDSGSFFSSFNVWGIKKLKILRSSNDIEKRFEKIVHSLRRMREIRNFENQELIQLRDFLLPLLMNGQIKVSEKLVSISPKSSY